MTIKQYNREFFPKYLSAHCLIRQLDTILDYLGDDARSQFIPFGWNEEMKQFLLDALESHREHAHVDINS